MKMAKASEADLRMAMDLANVLDDIERGYFPSKFSDDEDDGIEWIDTRNREQYERLVYSLKLLLNQGSISRVIWGMAVVCDPDNEAIDPDADTIEHHPKRLQLEKQRDELLASLENLTKQRDAAAAKCDEYFTQAKEFEQQRDELMAACEKTISENGHLADGDVCTLIDFKRAIASVKANIGMKGQQ